mmetsp:Transcript_19012/g.57446  ORF Transcript_19012/g.57446 Transcript_19012/m.57446 type:complete len:242 (-) Transcript_19012:3-728(-)
MPGRAISMLLSHHRLHLQTLLDDVDGREQCARYELLKNTCRHTCCSCMPVSTERGGQHLASFIAPKVRSLCGRKAQQACPETAIEPNQPLSARQGACGMPGRPSTAAGTSQGRLKRASQLHPRLEGVHRMSDAACCDCRGAASKHAGPQSNLLHFLSQGHLFTALHSSHSWLPSKTSCHQCSLWASGSVQCKLHLLRTWSAMRAGSATTCCAFTSLAGTFNHRTIALCLGLGSNGSDLCCW